MNGQKLLNTTLKINAAFSFLSGVDFILFDKAIAGFVFDKDAESLAGTGIMLVVFAIFVFSVSMMNTVNKYLVGSIILMDVLWVVGSGLLVVTSSAFFTTAGILSVLIVAFVIAGFAFFQTKGLRMHLANK